MLLSSTIGALAGLAYNNMQAHSVEYNATAKVAIEGPSFLEEPPPVVLVSVQTGGLSDEKQAIDSIGLMISQIDTYSDAPVMIRELAIDRNVDEGGWRKAAMLGAVIGMLFAIGAIYVWEDATAYQHHRQQSF